MISRLDRSPVAAWWWTVDRWFLAAFLSLIVGSAGGAAKQSFDAIVQRDAPDANFGRQFARFESRFQLFWCLGALVPVAFELPLAVGFAAISFAAGYAAVRYVVGARRAQEEHQHRLQMFAQQQHRQ